MAQKAFETIGTEWTALTDIMTPEDSTNYYIQNRGPASLIAVESAAEPSSDAGIVIPAYKVLKYVKGTNTLYLKSYGVSDINITDEN